MMNKLTDEEITAAARDFSKDSLAPAWDDILAQQVIRWTQAALENRNALIPYQSCPHCGGSGMECGIGNTSAVISCTVCNGKKIIPMAEEKRNTEILIIVAAVK